MFYLKPAGRSFRPDALVTLTLGIPPYMVLMVRALKLVPFLLLAFEAAVVSVASIPGQSAVYRLVVIGQNVFKIKPRI